MFLSPRKKLKKSLTSQKVEKTDKKEVKLEDKRGQLSQKILNRRVKKDHHPLSSFRIHPDKAEFINKDPEEKVILLIRKHPITNVRWVLVTFVLLIAPAFITVFPVFEMLPVGFQVIAVLSWYLLTMAFAFENFLAWFYHVNIVTDERIFDIDFVHMVHREMTDANIDQVQDVTVEIGSAIRTVFNFGDIIIQTAAQIPQITFDAVPQPDKVARILRELRVEEEVEKLEGRIR